jgi:hypothetical protein
MSGLTGYQAPSSSPSQLLSLMNCARTLAAWVTVPYTLTFCHT